MASESSRIGLFTNAEVTTSGTPVLRRNEVECFLLSSVDLDSEDDPPRFTSLRMSGFRAFKAQVPIQWSEILYITLVRGLPGSLWCGMFQIIIIEFLGTFASTTPLTLVQ
ncbi:hypothetical protein F2Q69_00030684 [Brassica cretica]|uniref:Uncharacterized protein n=1 Tax=Brassica cretica TaxID=69181 RepID=A0A8S9RZX8_BRACR|nr:hypothetical protein F2Q69_00030684 [Brassica cretica]